MFKMMRIETEILEEIERITTENYKGMHLDNNAERVRFILREFILTHKKLKFQANNLVPNENDR